MADRSNTSSTSSLTLLAMPGASPDGGASPRRAVSPLLEVRRPHCTLNCETCNAFLEDLYRHSRFNIYHSPFVFRWNFLTLFVSLDDSIRRGSLLEPFPLFRALLAPLLLPLWQDKYTCIYTRSHSVETTRAVARVVRPRKTRFTETDS